jgi:hypothetical protein
MLVQPVIGPHRAPQEPLVDHVPGPNGECTEPVPSIHAGPPRVAQEQRVPCRAVARRRRRPTRHTYPPTTGRTRRRPAQRLPLRGSRRSSALRAATRSSAQIRLKSVVGPSNSTAWIGTSPTNRAQRSSGRTVVTSPVSVKCNVHAAPSSSTSTRVVAVEGRERAVWPPPRRRRRASGTPHSGRLADDLPGEATVVAPPDARLVVHAPLTHTVRTSLWRCECRAPGRPPT